MRLFSPFQDENTFVTLKSPIKVYYDVAFSCNLRCSFCYVNWENLQKAGEFSAPSIQQVERILLNLREAQVLDLVILGGDFFSYKNHMQAIRIGKELGFGIGIITNATKVTPQVAESLAPYIDDCGVSFRGSNAVTFDRIVGVPGAFEAALSGLSALADAGVPISLFYDPMPENYGSLFATVRMLVEDHNLPIVALSLNRMIPEGRAKENWAKISLPLEAYFDLFEQMFQIQETYAIRPHLGDAFPFCYVPERYWSLLQRCDYGVSCCDVTSRGDVKKCSVSAISLDNLLERPLEEIWQTNVSLTNHRNFRWIKEECKRCALLRECGGGCSISPLGEYPDGFDSFTPQVIDATRAASYKGSLQLSTHVGHTGNNPTLLHPNPKSRPRLKSKTRFREDIVGILCVPKSVPVVIEQSEMPWLIVNELEKTVMDMCNGEATADEITQFIEGRYPEATNGAVAACLQELAQYGYLLQE